ncbi:MAG: guanylate kinase [Candidatus Firestonebacteria bacterium]
MLNNATFEKTLKRYAGKRGSLFVVSSPTAAGKTTVCRALVKADSSCVQSVSCTTRAPRGSERNGRDYYFLSEKKFKELIKKDYFLEWARVHTDYYGTPRNFAEKHLKQGKNVILTIDVQGARQIKKNCKTACFVFLLPPSFKELKRRLKKRGTEDPRSIKVRLATAGKELQEINNYQYLVINDTVSTAVGRLKAIILAETARIK